MRDHEPRATKLQPPRERMPGLLLILCAIPIPLLFFLVPMGMPLYLGGSCIMILTGISHLRNVGKEPSVCPFCDYFDVITPETTDYHCPSCDQDSVRRGDWLYPIIPTKREHETAAPEDQNPAQEN